MLDKVSAVLTANYWVLMALVPLLFSVIVFGWIVFLMRGRRMTTLQIKGLGLSLRVDTIEHEQETGA